MGRCQLCKERVEIPFKCSYCGQIFCDDHRLPENHLCPGLPKKREWSIYKKIRTQKWGLKREPTPQSKEKKPLEPIPIHGLEPKKEFNYSLRKTSFSRNISNGLRRLKKIFFTMSAMFLVSGVALYAINYLDTNYILRSEIHTLFLEQTNTVIGFLMLMMLVFCHELLHTMAWKHFGYNAKILLVTPMFGLARGTKPRTLFENTCISLAPSVFSITAILFAGYTVGFSNDLWMNTQYTFWGLWNLMGMGWDVIHALGILS